ncbi:MAG: hypothetical protein WBO04_08075 [Steroidobacteraceae bacterium]
MADSRFVDCIYCDDIRNEVGNKLTLVGCYGADLVIERAPATLPKLCVLAKMFTPVDQPFERLTLRVVVGETLLAELQLPRGQFDQPVREDSRWLVINAAMTLSPFFIEQDCTVRVEAESEDGTLIGPKLRVRQRTATPPKVPAAGKPRQGVRRKSKGVI